MEYIIICFKIESSKQQVEQFFYWVARWVISFFQAPPLPQSDVTKNIGGREGLDIFIKCAPQQTDLNRFCHSTFM